MTGYGITDVLDAARIAQSLRAVGPFSMCVVDDWAWFVCATDLRQAASGASDLPR